MVLLRLQHLFRSKEVFLSAVVLHSLTGTQAVPPAAPARLPAALGHSWPHPMGSGNTKLANKSLLLHSAESSTHSRILSYTTHPSLLRLKAFPGVIHWEINSEHSLLGQLYFAFPIAGLNDILLIPNCVCWGVFIYFCFSIRDPLTETQTLA